MTPSWTRRRFLATASAAASTPLHLLAQNPTPQNSQPNVMPPPGIITGGTVPVFEAATHRPLRYHAEGADFVIHNGSEFFNRPLYGPNLDFRVDAGDLPEFSLYLPGHGGNLKLGLASPTASKWLAQASSIEARYRPGRMIYTIQDPLLGPAGSLRLELLTAPEGSGLLLQITSSGIAPYLTLISAFGGVSGRKGRRNGDIGCEVEPVSRFFQLRPEECAGNTYTLAPSAPDPAAPRPSARLHSPTADIHLTFPAGATLRTADFAAWNRPPALLAPDAQSARPILLASLPLTTGAPLYLTLQRQPAPEASDPAATFAARSAQVAGIAATLRVNTPDATIDACAAAIGIAADAIWDDRLGCVMHGGVAWRVPLAGWRGPYALTALGQHQRARTHFRRWIALQNTSPITSSDPATGPADPNTHLARKEALLHSNGDLSHSHYDMNLVFFDVLLRHLRWTGDLAFAREIFPALKLHLAWERRLFRRLYNAPTQPELPLYEAYAVIWASDNLQYNGGGAAHSSAYMIFALRTAARIATLLGEDPTPYAREAALIHNAMQQLLWLPQQGAFAESKDIPEVSALQTVFTNPAIWTVYHTIDSEVPEPRQAWQMIVDRLAALRKVPIHGPGVPDGAWYLISCSDWLPYLWSLNLLVLAEMVHLALSMYRAGMPDEAFLLLKGNLLDSMFMGLTPGNFHMSSTLDPHRQEAQRDFGDPIGITARALTEGLFGVQPDLLNDIIRIRPGFPSAWSAGEKSQAALHHPDFDLSWERTGPTETYTFTSRFARPVPVHFTLPARTTSLPQIHRPDDRQLTVAFQQNTVGNPHISIISPSATVHKVTLTWHGRIPPVSPASQTHSLGDPLTLPPGVTLIQIDDPQGCLRDGKVNAPGTHTVFANMHVADAVWTLPITFTVGSPTPFLPVPPAPPALRPDPIDLTSHFTGHITEIFTRPYTTPRSPFVSLALPEQLVGGWANMDMSATVDDTGLRGTGGTLRTSLNVPFRTPAGSAPNCIYASLWDLDHPTRVVPLAGQAASIYLLITGTTFPQASRMQHGTLAITYTDGSASTLPLRNPETWWPIEQDYLLDDYLFLDGAPLPPRVDLRTGRTRILEARNFQGRGRTVPGGAASILHLPLDPAKQLKTLTLQADLYGPVLALLAATLMRST